MSNVTVRRANPDDSVLLARLARDTFLATYEESNEPHHIQAYVAKAFSPAQISGELVDDDSMFFVAERDAALIGYIKIRASQVPECIAQANLKAAPSTNGERRLGSNVAELERIYVDRRFIGTGVGRMLLDAAVAEAVRTHRTHLWLGVWKDNPEAVAFYRKCGFEIFGTKVFMMAKQAQDDHVMLLTISNTYDVSPNAH